MNKIISDFDIVVIGGGPAGLSSALSASKNGAKVAIIERDIKLGGILNQCIHNGFGLHYFGEELTGPEYADRFSKQVLADANIKVFLDTMVLEITDDKLIKTVSPNEGKLDFKAKAIILAMGCRERTAGAIGLTGSRPAGIYTAGMAQRLCNINGYLVGKKVVILGSGDIGLIMARRMTYEGAKIECVLELMPYSSGLKRNIVQCLNDYNIPLKFSHTVTRVIGKKHLEGLYIAPVDENLSPILEREEFIKCDALLLSVGLIPENDLVADMDLKFDAITGGAEVDEYRQTNIEGIFSCGNVLHVHDLVDNVSKEGEIAGAGASRYAQGLIENVNKYKISGVGAVRYALPHYAYEGEGELEIFFRVRNVYKNKRAIVKCGNDIIATKKAIIFAPGEMEKIKIDKAKMKGDITIEIED